MKVEAGARAQKGGHGGLGSAFRGGRASLVATEECVQPLGMLNWQSDSELLRAHHPDG